MKLSRRHRSLAFVAVIGVATTVASAISGDAVAGLGGLAILAVVFGSAEIARRRGSAIGAAMTGDRDERAGRIYEAAAARTAGLGYLALVCWVVYGTAAGTNTDGPGLAIVAFAAVFYANIAWITWTARTRRGTVAGAR